MSEARTFTLRSEASCSMESATELMHGVISEHNAAGNGIPTDSVRVTVNLLSKAFAATLYAAMKTAETTKGSAATTVKSGPAGASPGPMDSSFFHAEAAFHETQQGWLVLAMVWVVSASYTAFYLNQGWIPLDAGTLAQMAERVLGGQVPYLDFGEVYTGGLTYLNALAFRAFGVNFLSMRIMMFLFFLLWIPAFYFIARRFVTPLAAGAVTLLAVAWSVPNYPEAMPSWYNLFFTTWGVLALVRYSETNRQRWLWIGGLCAGLSFLIKITGLYFVAAALLFFVYRENQTGQGYVKVSKRAGLLYRLFGTGCLIFFLLVLGKVVSARPTISEFFHFFLPSVCMVAVLIWLNWREPSVASGIRFRRLFGMTIPFLSGLVIPVIPFLLWFAREQALKAWVDGTFIEPIVRTAWAAFAPIALPGLIGLVPAILIALIACDGQASIRRLARYGAPIVLICLLAASWKWSVVYALLGFAAPLVVPLIALVFPLSLRDRTPERRQRRELVFLVSVATVLWAIVQFPRSPINYFYYVAPLALLSITALLSLRKAHDPIALGSLLAFYLVFAVWLHPPGFFAVHQLNHRQPLHLQTITLPRAGGIRAPAKLANEYEAVIRLVQEHARGRYIYATPDCPEVYFLSGYRNPTRNLFPFLASDFFNVFGRTDRILDTIENYSVNVVVFNNRAPESGPTPAGLRADIEARFPQSKQVGTFDIRWRR